jgi:MarR family transcriptional regulator for hemolysin
MTTRTDLLRRFAGDLMRLARVYRKEVDRTLAEHGLSDARALPVLHIARAGGGMRQGVLAEELGIEGPSLVRLLDQICAAGLVERRDDPTDRRAKTLHVTEAGRTLAAKLESLLEAARRRLMSKVSDEDLAATLGCFSALEAELDATPARGKGS